MEAKLKTHFLIGALLAGWLGLALPARAAVKVDLSINQSRSDILTRGWENWLVKDGPSASRSFDGVAVTLRGDGGAVSGGWWKPGIGAGATMASDGVFVKGARKVALEIVLDGLPPGRHSLVTYHNWLWENSPPAPLDITVDGRLAVHALKPSVLVTDDADAASAFVEFAAEAGKSVIVRLEAEGRAVLNGFELDTPNPQLKASRPSPANDDEHTAENPALTWRPARGSVSHLLYFGTDAHAVAGATQSSPEFKGVLSEATFPTGGLSHFDTYFWRVDEVHPGADAPTRGDVWRFCTRFLAFPTAEGYGRFARGGRDGRVIEVTNLDDSGAGSLRDAIEAEGARTIVFRVSGLISLRSVLTIKNSYVTIAGQTAPGDGICLRNFGFGTMGAHDVIIRHIRVRVGDAQRKGLDGMGLASSDHCIVDHCSISWSSDEGFSSRAAKNITFQHCIISEALQHSYHYRASDRTKFEQHAFAASISGDVGSFHHNLLAHCTDRNWSLAGGYDSAGRYAGRLDIRNNVIFNWIGRTTDGGVLQLNLVNNFYKPLAVNPAVKWLLKLDPIFASHGTPKYFMEGNVMEGFDCETDNWRAFNGSAEVRKLVCADEPLFAPFVVTQTAGEAYAKVLADVGATRPRQDVIDRRIIAEVREGTTHCTGTRGPASDPPGKNFAGIIDTQDDVKDAAGSANFPWPEYRTFGGPVDSDHDGIPDDWERRAGLNPNDPRDASDAHDDGYTNLEKYLGWLAGEFPDPKSPAAAVKSPQK